MKAISPVYAERQARLNEMRLIRLRDSSMKQKAPMQASADERGARMKESGDIWKKRPYKKGEKAWHIKADFLNWINYAANYNAALAGSKLFFDRRDADTALGIPYRQLKMAPGNKYVLTVKFSTDEGRQPTLCKNGEEDIILELSPRLHIVAGKKFETFADFFSDAYAEAYSEDEYCHARYDGNFSEQEVSITIDFTAQKEKIPGIISIGTLCAMPGSHPSFYIDWIRVINETEGKEVYFNDFEGGFYEAASETSEEPGNSKAWRRLK
jgi:hypothetical protein